jgi:hypothetical protein
MGITNGEPCGETINEEQPHEGIVTWSNKTSREPCKGTTSKEE